MEKAISGGRIELSDSLLKEAHGNYLYVDDCDRIDPHTLATLMDCVQEGRVRVERDGISGEYPVDTTVIASMYSGSKGLGTHIGDRFDICVTMRRDRSDIDGAVEIIRRNLDADGEDRAGEDEALAHRIQKARVILPHTTIERHLARYISRVCRDYGVPGCRGAVAAAHTARALAALDGRREVDDSDISKACILCLNHRRTVDPEEEERRRKLEWKREMEARKVENIVWDGTRMDSAELEARVRAVEQELPEPETETVDLDEGRRIEIDGGLDQYSLKAEMRSGTAGFRTDGEEAEAEGDVMDLLRDAFTEIDLLDAEDSNGMRSGDEVAKRMHAETVGGRGKYIRSREPPGTVRDVAFDATIRAAAPYQRIRGGGPGRGIRIERQDIREKIREKEIMSTFLFVLDTSASLDVNSSFHKVRGMINSMLMARYVNRDRVALMTFNEKGIEMKLHPSRNAEKITSVLNRIKVDYGTPLSETLYELERYLASYCLKHPDEQIHTVLISDGRATVSMDPGKDPSEEALEIASRIDMPNVHWIVIDTGSGYTKNDLPPKLALALHAKYFLLDDLQPKNGAGA